MRKTDTRVLEETVKNPNVINYIDKERSLLHPRVSRMARAVSEAEMCRVQRPAMVLQSSTWGMSLQRHNAIAGSHQGVRGHQRHPNGH